MNLNFSANMAGFCRDSHICALMQIVSALCISMMKFVLKYYVRSTVIKFENTI